MDVGDEAEHRSAPVGATPGVGVVEPLVAGGWLSLRHVADYIVPNPLRGEIADHDSFDGFNISGESFLDPMLGGLVLVWILGHRWKGHVGQLVRDGPIGGEL